jgi:hypothetical protein
MKIMLHVLLKCIWDILKVISQNILLQSCFFPHELQKNGEIDILQTKSCDNLAYLFTKSLPAAAFQKCIHGIGMR